MADRLFFTTQAGALDTFLTHVRPDGSNLVSQVLDTTAGSPWQETVIDAAENRYYIFQYDQIDQNGILYTGQLNSSAAPLVAFTFEAEDLVGGLEIDTVNNKLYLSRLDVDGSFKVQPSTTGIIEIDYNGTTGALSNTNNFVVTQASDPLPAGPGFPEPFILATDLARDETDGTLYFARTLSGAQTNMIYRVDTSDNISPLLNQAQFPIDFSSGLIADVDVDAGRNLVYFSTFSQPFGSDANDHKIYVIADTATGSTNATAVTLVGLPGGSTFIPDDFTIDQATHQLYVESEENPGSGNSDDRIYRFQLSGDGLTATFLNTITPVFTTSDGNIGGLEFVANQAASLDLDANNSGGVAGNGYQATFTEGGSAVAIADTDTTITDDDANAGSATITLTNRQAGDLLSVNGGLPGGIVASAYDAGTGVLTLNGTTTLANYQTALRQIVFSNSSEAPSTVDRSITVTVNDGATNSNTATATIHVTPVDDAGVANDDSFGIGEASVLGVGQSVFVDNGGGADTDPDSTLTVTAVNGVAGDVGQAVTLASGALLTLNANGTFSYNPNGKFDDLPGSGSGATNLFRSDTFAYTIAGGDTATVTVTVSGVDGDGDVLRGTPGFNDSLAGGIGSDAYIVDDAGDTIVEVASEGAADRVYARSSFSLAADDDIEVLSTGSSTGKIAIDLKGNALAQTIYGNAGANTLHDGGTDGAPGPADPSRADRLVGLGGNDTYVVYNSAARVVEAAGQGNDRVSAGVDYKLASGVSVEFLNTTALGSLYAVNLTGNSLAQTIRGNDGANVLNDGGAGAADTLIGGKGDDHYVVYNSGDTITELAGEGTDRVSTFVDFALTAGAEIEVFTTTNSKGTSAIDLTGNAFGQSITGNVGDNRLDGGDGSDTLTGAAGADTYVFSTALGAGNIDTIAGYSVAADGIELASAIFATLATGALSDAAFAANAGGTATDAAHRILYDAASGALSYDADGDGGGAAQQFATLAAGLAMTAGEFTVV